MADFQSYLDKALQKLDVNETQNENNEVERIDYDINAEISELIQSVRKDAGLSQKQLSEKTKIPQANISKIENGHYLPSIEILKRIADGLGKRLVVDFVDIELRTED